MQRQRSFTVTKRGLLATTPSPPDVSPDFLGSSDRVCAVVVGRTYGSTCDYQLEAQLLPRHADAAPTSVPLESDHTQRRSSYAHSSTGAEEQGDEWWVTAIKIILDILFA